VCEKVVEEKTHISLGGEPKSLMFYSKGYEMEVKNE
jgi:hypothetical protein